MIKDIEVDLVTVGFVLILNAPLGFPFSTVFVEMPMKSSARGLFLFVEANPRC